MDDVILNKCETIERCIKRIEDGYQACNHNLEANLLLQESIILNLQRICETCIDLAMHLVRINKLGIPKDARDGFSLIANAKIISSALSETLQKMVGFRNIAVHQYQAINLDVVKAIIEEHLNDVTAFTKTLLSK